MWDNFLGQVYDNIIADSRYLMYLNGVKVTLLMTLGAAVIGVIIGTLVAIAKVAAKGKRYLRPLDILCDIYLTIIRGTPVTVQLMLFVYVIFTLRMDKSIYVATLAFGINSGAYVAEIVRAGIQAVNIGQTEAGRSLGLSGGQTMRHIILPQAIKNILPALCNEAIVLLKETAIAGYVAVQDVTYIANLIRSRTYSPVPLLTVALLYLIIVMIMTWGMRILERKLARSDKRGMTAAAIRPRKRGKKHD